MRDHVTLAGSTHIGKVREKNEDHFTIIDEGAYPYALILADGMGGHRKGELASQIAVDHVAESFREDRQKELDPETMAEQLIQSIENANVKVYLASKEDEDNRGMGTTLTMAVIMKKHIVLAHVGDCRAYLYRDGVLVQMTADHTLVQEMVAAGSLSPDETANHPRRNVLTRALGIPEYIQPDHLIMPREKGDRLLLSSDGLHGYVSDQVIETCIKKEKDPELLVQKLLDTALDAGGEDNVTVLTANI